MLPKPEKPGPKPRRRIARGRRPSPERRRGDRGKLRKLADDWMSLCVRHAAGWRCWLAGTRWARCKPWDDPGAVMQMAHLFPKGAHPGGRYLELNVRCLCHRCHAYYGRRWEEWRRLLIQRLGAVSVDWLSECVDVRRGPADYIAEILYWRQRLRERDDVWKVAERVEKLEARSERLGVRGLR